MATTVIGLFMHEAHATSAIRALKAAGFPDSALGLVTPDSTQREAPDTMGLHVVTDPNTPVDATLSHEGTVAGGILGGTIGALLAATGALIIPGIGPFIAGGILVTAIAGGALGAISGALVGLGVPKEDASYYEDQVHAGRTLVSVVAGERTAEAAAILAEHGAEPARDARVSDPAPLAP